MRIILVEDNPDDAELVLASLRAAGLEVEATVVSDEAGLARALASGADIVVSDHSLPGYDGLRALDAVRAHGDDIPFVLVSGTVSEELAVAALQQGAADYLAKDRLARLPTAVLRAIELSRARAEARRAQAAIRDSEQRLRIILATEPECIKVLDAQGRILDINPAGLRMLEIEAPPASGCGDLGRFVEAPFHEAVAALLQRVGAGETACIELAIRGVRGTRRWVEMHASPLHLPDEPDVRILGVSRDITAQKEALGRLERLNALHGALSAVNALVLRRRDRPELLHEACEALVGTRLFTSVWVGLVDPSERRLRIAARCGSQRQGDVADDAQEDAAFVQRALREGIPARQACADAPGASRRSAIALPLLVAGEVNGVIALHEARDESCDDEEMRMLGNLAGDIAFGLEHFALREQAQFVAMHDPVTRLPNRALFVDRVAQALQGAGAAHARTLVALLRIDRFGPVNDTLGRQAGDEVLRRVAERLALASRPVDTVARVGGNRFALLLPGVASPEEGAALLRSRVLPPFDRPVIALGHEVPVGFTIGVALADGSTTADALCTQADSALRRAAARTIAFHDPANDREVTAALALERRLRLALERDEFLLHYQPIFDREGRVQALEALLRWDDPERGLVAPSLFVAALEEFGLIVEAGRRVLARVEADVRAWTSHGLAVPQVHVNVSARELHEPGFVHGMRQAARRIGCRLAVEITESVMMDDLDRAASALRALRDDGIGAALDDFGTGYSSLAYASRLPISAIKVDRSFVHGLAHDPASRTIVASVVALGRALGVHVIAEGIEDEAQRDALVDMGCDGLQGYCLGFPMQPIDIARVLANARGRRG